MFFKRLKMLFKMPFRMFFKRQIFLSPEEQYKILSNGVVELINEKEFLNKLKQNRSLKIKAGFDPSRPDLHLGHSILINKLRQFQELGHEVFFVVGDFTACVGDPSGQNKTRPVLSFQEAKRNAKTYVKQVTNQNFQTEQKWSEEAKGLFSFFKRLDPKKTKCVFNSQWLDKIPLRDFLITISSKFTLARQLERNDFSLRYRSGKAIGLHELFYPILQAYDSMELKADIEIGGTDQLFNLLLGRELQEQNGQSPQVVLTLPLLEGIDSKGIDSKQPVKTAPHYDPKQPDKNYPGPGSRKMSKSLNNAIAFNDSPKDIYGKTMKISDALLFRWWNTFTEGKWDLEKIIQERKLNPKEKKEELAWLLVCAFHGEEKANQARKSFLKEVVEKGAPDPDEIHEAQNFESKETGVCELVKESELSSSNSEARRMILSGGVRMGKIEEGKKTVEWKKLTDPQATVDLSKKENKEFLLSFGKRKFRRVNMKWEEIHELKALRDYFVYKKDKEKVGEKSKLKSKLCKKLAEEDEHFKKADISLSSIKMKFENNRYLDTNGKEGLEHFSKQNEKIFNKYKDYKISEIEKEIRRLKGER